MNSGIARSNSLDDTKVSQTLVKNVFQEQEANFTGSSLQRRTSKGSVVSVVSADDAQNKIPAKSENTIKIFFRRLLDRFIKIMYFCCCCLNKNETAENRESETSGSIEEFVVPLPITKTNTAQNYNPNLKNNPTDLPSIKPNASSFVHCSQQTLPHNIKVNLTLATQGKDNQTANNGSANKPPPRVGPLLADMSSKDRQLDSRVKTIIENPSSPITFKVHPDKYIGELFKIHRIGTPVNLDMPLYLSGARASNESVHDFGDFKCIINMRNKAHDHEHNIQADLMLWKPIDDKIESWPVFKSMLFDICKILHTELLQGKKCLVHCTAGDSRSVAVLIYYFCTYYQLTVEEAKNLIQHQRPVIDCKFIALLKKEFDDDK